MVSTRPARHPGVPDESRRQARTRAGVDRHPRRAGSGCHRRQRIGRRQSRRLPGSAAGMHAAGERARPRAGADAHGACPPVRANARTGSPRAHTQPSRRTAPGDANAAGVATCYRCTIGRRRATHHQPSRRRSTGARPARDHRRGRSPGQCLVGVSHGCCAQQLPHRQWPQCAGRTGGRGRPARQLRGDQQGDHWRLPVQQRQRVLHAHRQPDHPGTLQSARTLATGRPVVRRAVLATALLRPGWSFRRRHAWAATLAVGPGRRCRWPAAVQGRPTGRRHRRDQRRPVFARPQHRQHRCRRGRTGRRCRQPGLRGSDRDSRQPHHRRRPQPALPGLGIHSIQPGRRARLPVAGGQRDRRARLQRRQRPRWRFLCFGQCRPPCRYRCIFKRRRLRPRGCHGCQPLSAASRQ